MLTGFSQLGAGGSVIANKGFIKQFGNGGGSGVRALDPTWGECALHISTRKNS